MTAVPRLVVTAPSSGHGKTAVAVGLLAALTASGLRTAGFKVGPDHTDAAYLGLATGRPGRNLDPRLVGEQRIAPLFAHGAAGAEVAVVEGTMGLFDSLAGRSEADSTAGVAGLLRAPVVLVIDVAAMGQSVGALVHGFRSYDELVWLGGVILNRVASERHEQLLREALDELGVPVFGALRRGELTGGGPAALPPRGQGPVPVLHRAIEASRAVRRLGETIMGAIDLERLLALARSAPRVNVEPWSPAAAVAADDGRGRPGGRGPVVALAGTARASYGYAETAELLTAAGATVVAVDPLHDETLPQGTDALVVCGGLPEMYAEELSANTRLRADVAELAHAGRPVIAEGAGVLWLAREFDGRAMCAVLDTVGATTDRMVVGYREATARTASVVAEPGARVVGYKHHRGGLTPRAGQAPAWSWNGSGPEGFVWRRVHASQLMLHWAGAPEIAARLVGAAAQGAGDGRGYPGGAGHPTPGSGGAGHPAPGSGGAGHPAHAPGLVSGDTGLPAVSTVPAPTQRPGASPIGAGGAGLTRDEEQDKTAVLQGPTLAGSGLAGAEGPQAGGAVDYSVPVRVEYRAESAPVGGGSGVNQDAPRYQDRPPEGTLYQERRYDEAAYGESRFGDETAVLAPRPGSSGESGGHLGREGAGEARFEGSRYGDETAVLAPRQGASGEPGAHPGHPGPAGGYPGPGGAGRSPGPTVSAAPPATHGEEHR